MMCQNRVNLSLHLLYFDFPPFSDPNSARPIHVVSLDQLFELLCSSGIARSPLQQ